MVDRRLLLAGGAAVAAVAVVRWFDGPDVEAATTFEIQKSDSEWRRLLSKPQYEVLRLHRTEIPGSSPLNSEKRAGTFVCAACELPLFSSATKYDSGTGWPSFYQPLRDAVGTADRPCAARSAHRGPLPALRRASRPRLQRRPAAHRPALLHQRRRHDVRAARPPDPAAARSAPAILADARHNCAGATCCGSHRN